MILNNPEEILEPSCGRGDLVLAVQKKFQTSKFDLFEIDQEIEMLEDIGDYSLIYTDFLSQKIQKTYSTIIGNPPFVRTKKGNLYIDFCEKCFELLDDKGELVFIVPSDIFKLTCARDVLKKMMDVGTFTHIFHPQDEKMFENASIDIIIFRYCKDQSLPHRTLYNDKQLFLNHTDGMITFDNKDLRGIPKIEELFNVYVGMVSACEQVFKNQEFGNISVINEENKENKYIFIEKFPTKNTELNKYLLSHKETLLKRKIRKFREENWFEWGASRNISTVRQNMGEDCIYIHNLTRKKTVSFKDTVKYCGGGLIMLIPKSKKTNLNKVVCYLNSEEFRSRFMYSGRFKIGHRQLCNSAIEL
jgi:adenine-specific DNA-methyltransferase